MESWGRYPKAQQEMKPLQWRDDPLPRSATTLLPRGLGRSYGDSCLNDGGVLVAASGLDRFLAFDEATGMLTCEAGATLDEIIRTFAPRGFFPPVVPGTKFITIGGAIANDVHGKNHHGAGTFGCHVERFTLRRSSGETLACSRTENAGLFAATIGGLGLTGVIVEATVTLKRIASMLVDVETIRFEDFDGFCDLAASSENTFEHTVAWMDAAPGRPCRGLFMRGEHAADADTARRQENSIEPRWTVPDAVPEFLLNGWTFRAFNFLYYHRHRERASRRRLGFDPFFFPLDAIGAWNRLYGRRGFLQHQCVVPMDADRSAARLILGLVKGCEPDVACGLAVVKTFGDRQSPGMLSFPRKGVTFALDYPADRRATFELLDRIDRIVRESGGAVYPAKDARMAPETFRAAFPRWQEFARFIDPAFSSSFWRRVAA